MTATLTTCSKIRLSFKCVQLILACICIGLFANTHIEHQNEAILMAVTFGGFIIILGGVILGFVTGERCPKKVDLLYTLVGLGLFVAAGSVAISEFNKLKHVHSTYIHVNAQPPKSSLEHPNVHTEDPNIDVEHHSTGTDNEVTTMGLQLFKKAINIGLAMGSISIINGAFFLFDAVLSYKDVNEYTPHQ